MDWHCINSEKVNMKIAHFLALDEENCKLWRSELFELLISEPNLVN
jgi:hypothetical protein